MEVNEHAPGSFCWAEIGTTDRAAAKRFYSELFNWKAQDVEAGEAGTYTLMQLDGKDVCGLYELNKEQQGQGIPPHWLSYVSVDSADAATQKAKNLGAAVMMEPCDVMQIGRMSLMQDPTGAHFAIWQSKEHKGFGITQKPGTPCWFELATKNTSQGGEFYHSLFGWEPKTEDMGPPEKPMPYTMMMQGEKPAAGMMEMTEEWGNIPPHWMVYVEVEDCDAVAKRAESLGGKVQVPPTDIPPVGRFSVISDPTGATFSVIKLSNPSR
jgi:predicted enzyme related to lactoylglutathione lyase